MRFHLYLILAMSLYACQQEQLSTHPPNIILFLVDDMGWQDTSVPFWKQATDYNKRYHTPAMERLATEGMKFTQAYATAVCSPTRISLMTGMNAARHRVTNWTLYPNQIQPMETNHETLQFPVWNVNGLAQDTSVKLAVHAKPLPAILKENGYYTIHAGKAHFGAIGTPGEDPLNLGFDKNIAGHAAGAPRSYRGTENFGNDTTISDNIWAVPGLEKYHGKDINLTEALTLEAISAMKESVQMEQPFYLYMSHYTIHTPIMEDDRFYQRYLDEGLDTVEAKYASMIESMDKSLGDLMNFLDTAGLGENTVVLFMSDNGGLSAHTREVPMHRHNSPLSSGKGSAHEGGIRVPMIVKWPQVTSPGSATSQPVIIEDFFPTILAIANITNPTQPQIVDGISFKNVLESRSVESGDRALVWHYPNEWGPSGPGIGASSSIRLGDWKLIYYHQSESFELFNIEEDIGESDNLIDSEPEVARRMASALSEYLREVDAQMPIHKDSGVPVAWPNEKI